MYFALRGGGEGGPRNFFWRIRFELWAPKVPLIIGETFGEVLGPRRRAQPSPSYAPPRKNIDFWASYGPIWAILATRDEIGRALFGPLRPYHWS